MTPIFEPNPLLLAFLLLKTSLYLPAIAVLGVLRAIGSSEQARAWGILAVVVALLGLAARFGPSLLGLSGGPVAQTAYAMSAMGGGMVMALAGSVPLAVSALMPGRRWLWVDALHILLVSALFVLWLLAQ